VQGQVVYGGSGYGARNGTNPVQGLAEESRAAAIIWVARLGKIDVNRGEVGCLKSNADRDEFPKAAGH
jgi:hypothetical protein